MSTAQFCDNDSLRNANSTSDLWLVENRVTGQVTAAFLLLILVVGLPWNLLVAFTIVKEKLYHQPTIVLLLNLVMNDLVLLVLALPPQIVTGIAGEYIIGNTDVDRCISCHLGVLEVIFSMMSIYTISVMALDRFLYIYKPLRYEKMVTSGKMVVLLIVIWIFLFMASILPLFGRLDIVFNPSYLSCTFDFSKDNFHYFIILLALAVIPILSFLLFNIWVVWIVQKNIRAIYNIGSTLGIDQQKAMRKKGEEKEYHMIRVFTVLLGSNLLEWLPTIILVLYLLIVQAEARGGPTKLIAAFHVFFVSQIAVHPIIETVLIKDVREPLKKLMLRIFCCGKRRNCIELSWSCENSCLQHCSKFMDVLEAAVMNHSDCSLKQKAEVMKAVPVSDVHDAKNSEASSV